MKERPILFSGPMVRALLAGTKTQTRRVVKPQPAPDQQPRTVIGSSGFVYVMDNAPLLPYPEVRRVRWDCPYGQPGDRLWVKEAWRTADTLDALSPTAIADKCVDAGYSKPWAPLQWEADGQRNREWSGFGPGNGIVVGPGKTRVSMHMPRWASRINLEITSVRVERLQDISPDDCIAEGAWPIAHRELGRGHEAVAAYQSLWESINGPGSWAANPWVWVLEFRRIDWDELPW